MSGEMESAAPASSTVLLQDEIDVSSAQRCCFFACLDILGFKNIVKQNTFDQLKGIVEAFTADVLRAVDDSRSIKTDTGNVVSKIKLGSKINVRIVSDSIYVWTVDDDRLKQFDDMLHIVRSLIVCGFRNGLPLRGVVTYGELFSGDIKLPSDIPVDFSFEAGSLYGRALVEAYELEGQMDWSGAILTPRAWAKVVGFFESVGECCDIAVTRSVEVDRPEELFRHYPYFVWYDVPFKTGTKKGIAYNWNYKPGYELSEEMIRGAFVRRGEATEDAVEKKLRETIRFYEYTERVAELCGFGLKRTLPMPDPAYVLSDL